MPIRKNYERLVCVEIASLMKGGMTRKEAKKTIIEQKGLTATEATQLNRAIARLALQEGKKRLVQHALKC